MMQLKFVRGAAMENYRIAEARAAKGWSQAELAKRVGTSQQQIARWEGSSDVKAGALIKLSEVLGVTVQYLLGMGGQIIKPTASQAHPMPVFGRIAAGTPREALMQSEDTHDTPESLYYDHVESFWLVVSGNSMNRLFPDGSLVLIDPKLEVRNGDVGAVFVNGDDATLKRVYYEDGQIILHPESYDPEYKDRVITENDPDAPAVRIIGKAVSYTAPDNWRA